MAGPLVRPRPYAREIALTAAVAALLWIAIAALLYQQRDNRLSAARADAAGLARVFAENTAHAIDAADQAMLVMRAVYLGDPAHFTFAAWNDSVRYSDGMIIQTAIIGPDGLVIQTNLGMIKGTMDLSDREHFRVQRDSTADFLFISKPVLGRASGRWTIQLTRRILGADGRFGGVFVVSLDPVILSRPFVAADIGHGSVVLAGIDGVIRAGAPDAVTLLGQTVAPASLLAATRASEQGTIAFRDPAGSPVIASFRAVGRYGLSITVMLNQDDVLAGYRRNRFNYIAGGAGLTTLLLIVGGSLVRHKRRLLDARGALLGSRALLAETLESITQGIMMIDEDLKIPVINRRALELLGLPASFMQVDPDFRELLTWQEAEGEFGAAGSAAADAARRMELDRLREGDDFYERVRPDGTIVEVRTTRLHGRRAVRTLTDVTERRRAEDRINYLSHHADHDVLTGLANRARFHERLNEAISIAKRVSTGFMVLFLDLDQFKQVNDTMGHAAGDQLLKLVAERLREAVRDTDTVARFGGDEFAVLQALVARPEVGAVLAQRLIRSLSAPYRIDERQAIVGVSIGLAVYPRDGREADDLLKSADIALYAAKKDGRGTCRFFEPEMDRRVLERTELARDLREAIAADGVVPQYQPICDAGSGQVLGYEALARWRHPIRGQVSPADFIPLAEETGLIVALGLNVLKTACRTAAGWSDGAYVTVNVSPMQLTVPGFELVVLGVLRESGLPPNRLRIEITEGVLMREGDGLPKALNLLRQHGVRILLDDFGTGHAGLSYLLRFPFDGIKVDRSFVSRIVDNAAAQAIIQATLVLSASLKLDVIAEGVETEEQRAALRLAGCRHVQGYLFGAPMPADAIPSAPAELAPSPTTGAPGPGPPESGALDPTSRAA